MTDTVHNPVATEEEIKAGDGDTAVSVEKKEGGVEGEGEGEGEGGEDEKGEKEGKQDKEEKEGMEEQEGKQDKADKEEKEGKQDKEEKEGRSEKGESGEKAKDETKARPKNVKFDASLLPKSNDPAEIRKQIEFYFSNSNLPFDKFLWGLVTKENNPVPLKLVATFKRMRRFEDYPTIVAAMRESDALEVAGGDGEETIRRKVPLPIGAHAPQQKEPAGDGEEPVVVRTVFDKALKTSMYAKGFGDETPTTQIDVEKMFEPYGPINCVRLRRDDKLVFKGSVFVEFGSLEALQKFVALEAKPTFNGTPLEWKTKEDYVRQKQEDIAAGRIKPSSRTKKSRKFNAYREERFTTKKAEPKDGHRHGGRNGRDGGRGGRGRGRGGRGGSRAGRDNKNGNASPAVAAAAPLTDKHGVPQLVDTPEPSSSGTKRKNEDGSDDRQTKKPKEAAENAAAA